MNATLAAALSLVAALAAAAPAQAHDAGPCNDSGEPGNSDYAQHHIRPNAEDGNLGNDGHKPGSHEGYSACDPSGG